MREIDSTRNSEARLTRALRSLSASSPVEAPPQIGEVLAGAFRRHHARRRAIRRTAIAAVIFCVVLPATVLLVNKRHGEPTPATDAVVASPPAKNAAPPVAVASPLPVRAKKSHAMSGGNNVPTTADTHVASSDGFVELPSADQAVRGEDLRVVRLEVTGRALQMVGAPVAEESADNRMLADFIVGQDGTPYAVRLVR